MSQTVVYGYGGLQGGTVHIVKVTLRSRAEGGGEGRRWEEVRAGGVRASSGLRAEGGDCAAAAG
eukprot:scaffold1519_cov99-Isochrysis_galbana.AAC.12